MSFRPTCFRSEATDTRLGFPVQHELKTERFGMAYRLMIDLGLCPSEI